MVFLEDFPPCLGNLGVAETLLEWDHKHMAPGQALLLIGQVILVGVGGGHVTSLNFSFFIHQMGIIFGPPAREEKFTGKRR